MSKIRMHTIWMLALILGTNSSVVFAQSCQLSGTAAWNRALRNIISDCPVKFVSPDGRLVVRIGPNGMISLWEKGRKEKFQWKGPKLEPPAMFSWSPKSNAFFLNDGDGSGLSSEFRLFRIRGGIALEDKSFERAAVLLYRRRTHCSPSSVDPNVWGFAWGLQGSKVVLLVQPTVSESCGSPGDFISVVIDIADAHIAEILSKEQTKLRFGSILPPSLFVN